MRYLITGGAGFIGSHLAEYILDLEAGHTVTIVDDFSTGSMNNLNSIKGNEKCNIINGTILDNKLVEDVVCNCDLIFHLASSVGVKYILKHQIKSLDTTLLGSRNIFLSAAHHKKRVIFSSSSEVYGKNEQVPYQEDSDKIIGSTNVFRWSYSVSKNIAEYYLHALASQGLRYDIFRLFNVVGPRQSGQYGMVLPTFVQQALSGNNLTVYGDGRQVRCFTYIDDIINIFYLFSQMEDSTNSTFNIGNDAPISIGELADLVIKISGSNSIKTYIPHNVVFGDNFEDCLTRIPDVRKLVDFIGEYPFKNIVETIQLLIQYYS